MPNSSESQTAGAGYVELVRARDTHLETRFVFLTVLGILLLGALSLLFLRRDGAQDFVLPVALTSLTTQLSNAREEIQLLQEIGLLNQQPDLAALIEAELPPFAQTGVVQAEPGCLVFDRDPYLLRFQQSPLATDGWEIAWLDEREAPEINHALHTTGEGEALCEDHGEWQSYEAKLK